MTFILVPLAALLDEQRRVLGLLLLSVGVATIATVILSFAGTFGGKRWADDLHIIIYSQSFYMSIGFITAIPHRQGSSSNGIGCVQ